MKIAVVGAGNMGGAIIKGLLDKNFIRPSDLMIFDPCSKTFDKQGIKIHPKITADIVMADVILIAVKPRISHKISKEIVETIGKTNIIICSVVAGFTLDEMAKIFKTHSLFRIMPNTAVGVGEGMTFIAPSSEASEVESKQVSLMFENVGKVMTIEESQMEACMALASCGIAYALRYIRAATVGGVELGMAALPSQAIITQTLRGAAALLECGEHPEVEIDRVTTPGGITIKGLNAMEEHGFTNAVIQGLRASK